MRELIGVLAAAAACCNCSKSGAAGPLTDRASPPVVSAESESSDSPSAGGCADLGFAASLPLAEASGAVLRPSGDGGTVVVVVGDSGNRGAFSHLDPATGAVLDSGHLPLDGAASDDLEGLSTVDGQLIAITSAGWLRHWISTDGGYQLSQPAYPIGNVADGTTCREATMTNCGPDYEGLCFFDRADNQPCAGYAVAKRRGDLVCLIRGDDGRFRADPERSVHVVHRAAASGCDIADGSIWVGTNMFAGNAVARVTGWAGTEPVVDWLGPLGPGFGEAIAVASGGIVYRFSDTGSSPSLMSKYKCD